MQNTKVIKNKTDGL